ncbi:GNAT family N-acetyltransferase [Candidatus Parcubacteria bacterium]|nr:GNAT family N-acetyltransferase [Candidatus Parcubacteria bacterium]
METLKIKRIDNIEEAKSVWMKLTPDKTICDNWNFRYCFYKYFNYPLHFYVGLDKEKIVGLLPLQYNEEKRYLEFFGGSFMSDNRIFIKPEYKKCIPQFYGSISQTAELRSIIGEDLFTKSLDVYRYKYVADLSGLKSGDDYFAKKFKARSRKKLRNKLKLVEPLKPNIITNNYDDLDLMMNLNRKAFGEKSSFSKPYRSEIFHDLLKLDFDFCLLSFVVNDKKEAISFSLKYKDTYVYINSGTNKKDMPDIGSYVIFKQIERAIEMRAKSLDARRGDSGWKEIWHLEKFPQYMFMKK